VAARRIAAGRRAAPNVDRRQGRRRIDPGGHEPVALRKTGEAPLDLVELARVAFDEFDRAPALANEKAEVFAIDQLEPGYGGLRRGLKISLSPGVKDV
jgi:hypothetical protein